MAGERELRPQVGGSDVGFHGGVEKVYSRVTSP